MELNERLFSIIGQSLDENRSIALSHLQELLAESDFPFTEYGFSDLPDMIEGVNELVLNEQDGECVVVVTGGYLESPLPADGADEALQKQVEEPQESSAEERQEPTPEQLEQVAANVRKVCGAILKGKPNPKNQVAVAQLTQYYKNAGFDPLPEGWKLTPLLGKMPDKFNLEYRGTNLAFISVKGKGSKPVADAKASKGEKPVSDAKPSKGDKPVAQAQAPAAAASTQARPEPVLGQPTPKVHVISRLKYGDFFYFEDAGQAFSELEQMANPESVIITEDELETDQHFYVRTSFTKNFADLVNSHPEQILITYDGAEFPSGFYTSDGKAIRVQLELNRRRDAQHYQSFVFKQFCVQE